MTAPIAAARLMASMVKYSALRRPMVSGLPTEGGLAGYFRNGTTNTAPNPTTATSSDVPRAPSGPTRP